MKVSATMPIAERGETQASTLSSSEFGHGFEGLQHHWPTIRNTTASERIAKLKLLRATVLRRHADIVAACYADFQKPAVETELAEIGFIAAETRFAIQNLKGWMRPRRVQTPLNLLGTSAEIRYEPKGVGLIISPWNYPFSLTLGPLIGAIAAGCCVVVKPSEHTPHSSRLLRELLGEVFDKREVMVVEGDHLTAQALLKLPFNHIYFTGSPEVGKLVMKAAAEHLASVTLELGGKSPTIVDETADIGEAAQKIAWGKFTNSGQTCIAPDYVLVDERVHDQLVSALRQQINTFYGMTPLAQQSSRSYARMVNDKHHQRVERLYDDAVAHRAHVVTGGLMDRDARYIAPTVLTDVSLDAAVMHEEIFGPLLPVVKYGNLDKALAFINSKPYPLALYIFSKNKQNIQQVMQATTAGGTCVNETLLHFTHPELPFGGIGNSGVGKGYGYHGFLAFSNERSVLRRTVPTPLMRMFYPPYSRRARKLVDWLVRFF